MADGVKENALTNVTDVNQNDSVRLIGSDNASKKALLSAVSKSVVEEYNGTSLAGSSQTIKSAVDALNSKIALNLTVTSTDSTNIEANIKAIADGIYTEIGNVNTSFAGNVFVTGHDAYTVTGSIRNNVTKFSCIRTSGNMFKVVRTANGTITYKEVANKDDVDALNSKLLNQGGENIDTSNVDSLTTPAIYARYIQAGEITGVTAMGGAFGLFIVTNATNATRVGQYMFIPHTGYIAMRYNGGSSWSAWRAYQLPSIS